MSILIAIIVFGVIILVHEVGHFVAARRCGIWVEEFAIGMGPKLFGVKRGETLYSIRMLPIGGFCRMYGDEADVTEGSRDDDPSLSDRALNNKSIPQRLWVMFAGSFMNFVLAFVLFSIIAALNGINSTTLRQITPGSPAEAAGIVAGDRITHLNGSRIFLWDDISFEVTTGYGRPVALGFLRDGERHNVVVTPAWNEESERYLIGVSPERRLGLLSGVSDRVYRVSIGEVLTDGFMRIGFVVRTIVLFLIRIFTAQLGLDQVAGPIGIVNMIGGHYQEVIDTAAELDVGRGVVIMSIVLTMTNFAAVISANLGVMNLLPLPALDGGRIVFLFLEAIRRKPISPEREGMVHLAGFMLLMILAVFIAYNDILNIL